MREQYSVSFFSLDDLLDVLQGLLHVFGRIQGIIFQFITKIVEDAIHFLELLLGVLDEFLEFWIADVDNSSTDNQADKADNDDS